MITANIIGQRSPEDLCNPCIHITSFLGSGFLMKYPIWKAICGHLDLCYELTYKVGE